mgnify:CR=1 FL=1
MVSHYPKRVLFLDLVLSVFRLNGLLISEGDAMTQNMGLTHARWKVIGAIALSTNGLTVPGIARVPVSYTQLTLPTTHPV